MSERMRWLLLTILISLSRGDVCRNIGSCSCLVFNYRQWEIRCPSDSNSKFIARFNSEEANWQVECRDATSWSEFGDQFDSSSSFNSFNELTIARCPLPDESFRHITKRFGLGPMTSLTFASHMNLSTTLTRRHLSMLPTLSTLDLSSNGLTKLPSDLFRDVGELRQLDLSFNKIAMLPPDLFLGLLRLSRIDLSYNEMKFVDWSLFGNCTSLSRLSLRGNLLTTLDHRTFRDTHGLYRIDLAENLLETLPSDAFDNARELLLNISGNRFSTLPDELFSRTGLTELTLSHNRGNLTTLPKNFLNNLTKLERVILIQNNLTCLPENIFWGSFSVQSIDLHGNALSTLPKDIFRDLRALISLDLSENRLNDVPEGLFAALRNLRRLNLARNDIASIPKNMIRNLDSLLELNLGFNKINDIYWKMFGRVQNIGLAQRFRRSDDRTGSHKSILEKYTGLSTIQKLFLDHNNLTGNFFIEGTNGEVPMNLHFVDLSYNQISAVEVFGSTTGSQDVEYDLRHNNLSDIRIFDEISSKVSILVDDNPLYCGCRIYDSLKYRHIIKKPRSRKTLEIIWGNALCSKPFRMIGTPLASLRFENFTCRPDDDNRHVHCAEGCDCWWRPRDKTRIVDCSSRNLREMPDELIEFVNEDGSGDDELLDVYMYDNVKWSDWRNSRVELNLANNSFTEIPTVDGSGYEHVEILVLSHKNISKLSFDLLPPRLKMLYLDHNELRTLNATTVKAFRESSTLSGVNLERNPWNCDADTRNHLASLEKELGRNARYSFDMHTCLDSRRDLCGRRPATLHISFTRF